MQLLSPHFSRDEFELDGPMPEECVAAYTTLCKDVLEPIRVYVQQPIWITSGFRTYSANKANNGSPNSEHMATADWCAADFKIDKFRTDMRSVFDWIRNNPKLPFHQVTLEHGDNGDIIHISWNRNMLVRQALEGATYNRKPYLAWNVVPMETLAA